MTRSGASLIFRRAVGTQLAPEVRGVSGPGPAEGKKQWFQIPVYPIVVAQFVSEVLESARPKRAFASERRRSRFSHKATTRTPQTRRSRSFNRNSLWRIILRQKSAIDSESSDQKPTRAYEGLCELPSRRHVKPSLRVTRRLHPSKSLLPAELWLARRVSESSTRAPRRERLRESSHSWMRFENRKIRAAQRCWVKPVYGSSV